uniref:Nectin cell adhesion molecule 4a n=1 Tax=Danio rerio TaxID=7955 RepID=E7F9P1_DANRE|nr:nectin-4 isoform X1 [Danio rerio]|eukprot:XP_689011.4 nectin-4 isoform X1 [Danio rerio]
MMKAVSYVLAAVIFWNSAARVSGEEEYSFLEPSESPWDLWSLAEGETRLPCRFNVSDSEITVVQVLWIRENNGVEEQILTAHFKEGQTEFHSSYSGRVRFETNNPIADSALIIMRTLSADEGKYKCKIITFPSGNFEAEIVLTVWTKPISSLKSYTLIEGQSFRPAASCRAMAKPVAGLSWDTELPGQSQNQSSDESVSSIKFSLHPYRSMNGQKLDCLVWHPSQKGPERISNKLIVHYPPNAVISGYKDDWFAEMQGATLQCSGEGNPKPHLFNWTRKDGALPEGVIVDGGTLLFSRPLRLADKGHYICTTTNLVGSGKTEIEVKISEPTPPIASVNFMLMITIAALAAGVVLTLIGVIICVNRHYKRKNNQLAIELDEKKVEINTLSRQASFRRVNSSSTDNRYSEDNHPLRVEGTIRTSLSSLDRPRSRDSRSTLGGVDSLGRPAIYNTSRRGREKTIDRADRESARLMMESFEQDSNMSQETHLLPPLHPSSYTMDQPADMVRSRNGNAILPAEGRPHSGGSTRGGSSRHHSPLVTMYPTLTDEEEGSVSPTDSGVHRGTLEHDAFENGDSETTSSQISEALSSHFERTNGTLRPKVKPNNIILPANTTIYFHPHSPPIHKAQIV